MANNIIRPDNAAVGRYNSQWTISTTSGFVRYSQCLDEAISDDDLNYIHTEDAVPFTVEFGEYSAGSFVRPTRVYGVTVIATVRVPSVNPTRFKFRMRYLNADYDSEEYEINSTSYVEVFKTYKQLPNGNAWNGTRIKNLEVGLVYVSGVELRCTKLELQVHTEPIPHTIVAPDADGATAEWFVHPSAASGYQVVGAFDGNQSYLYSNTLWTDVEANTAENLNAVWGTADDNLYTVGTNGFAVKYDGVTWTQGLLGEDDLHAIWGSSPNDIFVVGNAGKIWHWDGIGWEEMTSGVSTALFGVWGSAANDVYVVGAGGTILQYDGISWSAMTSGTTDTIWAVWGDSASDIYAVGYNGMVLYYNGAVWAPMVSGSVEDLRGVWGSAASDVYAVGDNGEIIQWNGAVWAPLISGTTDDLFGIWGSSSTNAVAVGENGTAIYWDGTIWGDLTPNTTEDLNGIWGVVTPDVFMIMVGDNGEIRTHDTILWYPQSSFSMSDIGAPLPPVIDRVQAVCQVRNLSEDVNGRASVVMRSGGTDYYGAHSQDGIVIEPGAAWNTLEESFLNDPNTGWPSGAPGSTPWTPAEINSLEIGLKTREGNLRCTTVAAEVFLKNNPVSIQDMFPTADGSRQDLLVFPGGNAWDAVDEDPPDYGVTYIHGDADIAGTPQYSTFTVGPAVVIPAGEQITAVEMRTIMQLGVTSSALVAPIIKIGNETYIGRIKRIDNTSTSWFATKEDFIQSPFSGKGWSVADVNTAEYGIVVLEGEVNLTQLRVQVQTGNLVSGSIDPTDLQLTDYAENVIIPRSKTDGTIFFPLEFGVGSGGFDPANPGTVIAVNPLDVALINEVYRDKLSSITYDADNYPTDPYRVQFWCRVPKDTAISTIGELGIYAKIIWSPIPAEIDTWFLFAIMHFPCQCRHNRTVHAYTVEVVYP